MRDLIFLIGPLTCALVMGAMMLIMMRGGQQAHAPIEPAEVAGLRAEIEQLRAQVNSGSQSSPASNQSTTAT